MEYGDAFVDEFDTYEELYDAGQNDRKARRGRKSRINPKDRKTRQQAVKEVAAVVGLEAGFAPTYQPSRYEEGWLLQSLEAFYEQDLLSDVLAMVKGGKEASVYRCEAHPDTGLGLVAAKVYRPRMFRNLRNDKMYRQGREIMTPEGRPVGLHGERVRHAIAKKTSYGRKAAHSSWLMHEFTTLEVLYNAGAAVPRPIAANNNAILMGYCGDERYGAPTLHEVTLEPEEVQPLFREVLRNIDLMLQHDLIHGDLSAYNILYWAGRVTLIDFPQVVNPATNDNAYKILLRDITRVCEHFARYGLQADPARLMDQLWRRYVGMTPQERAADEVRFLWQPEEDDDDGEDDE